MARTFTRASGDLVALAPGALDFAFGPGTLVAICRKASDPAAYAGIISVAVSSSHDEHGYLLWTGTSSQLMLWNGLTDTAAPFGFAASDGWCLVAVTKATGTVAPRFHKYVYSTNTWTHQDSGSTAANGSTGSLIAAIGRHASDLTGSSGAFDGDIAAAGVFDVVLGDQQIEALAFTLQAWFQAQPRGLWLLDQDKTTQKVVDFSGGGANESSLSGTSVATSSVPVFNYGAEIWLPIGSTPASPAPGSTPPLQIPNARVGPMALRRRFRRAYAPQSPTAASTTPVSSVAGFPFEALQLIAAVVVEPVEAPAGVTGSGVFPVEALQAIAAAAVDAIEAGQGIATTDPLVLEAIAGVTGSGSFPLESLRSIATQLQDSFEALAAAAAASSMPIEAGQGIATPDAVVLEALGGVAASGADPFEAQGNVPVTQTLALAFEALAGASTPGALPVETVAALAAAAVAPVEAVQALSRAQAAPVEAPAGVAAAGVSPLESLARIASSPAFPFEARIAATLIGVVVAAFDPPDPQAPTGGGFDAPRPSGMFDTPDPGPAV